MRNIIATVLGLSLLVSGAAMAAPGNERGRGPDDRGPAGAAQHAPGKGAPMAHRMDVPRGPAADHRPGPASRPLPPPRPGMGVAHGPSRHMAPPPRGGHHAPVYRKGYRLPPHAHGVVVRDYRGHGLHKAPRGHEWRSIDGRYLLVAIATGVITDIVLNGR